MATPGSTPKSVPGGGRGRQDENVSFYTTAVFRKRALPNKDLRRKQADSRMESVELGLDLLGTALRRRGRGQDRADGSGGDAEAVPAGQPHLLRPASRGPLRHAVMLTLLLLLALVLLLIYAGWLWTAP